MRIWRAFILPAPGALSSRSLVSTVARGGVDYVECTKYVPHNTCATNVQKSLSSSFATVTSFILVTFQAARTISADEKRGKLVEITLCHPS